MGWDLLQEARGGGGASVTSFRECVRSFYSVPLIVNIDAKAKKITQMKSLMFMWREGKKIPAFLHRIRLLELDEIGEEQAILPCQKSPLVHLIL